MNKLAKKVSFAITVLSIAVMSMPFSAYASSGTKNNASLDQVVEPVVKLIESLLDPLLALVGAGGSLYCVFLGIKYAKADDPQEHDKAKKALKNAIIGFILIFVLMLAFKLAMPRLTEWVKANQR